jgi:Flp pilus assembly protein TadD
MEPKAIAPRLQLARLQAARGDYTDAQQTASDAERIAPAAPEVHEELAAIAADAGDTAALTSALVRLRELQPRGGRTSYFEAVLYMITGHPAEAIPFAREAVRSDRAHATEWNLLGSALGATNAPDDEIRNAFTRAVWADRSDAAAYANLGMLELSSGRAASAANWFAQALTVDPANAAARKGLAAARAAMY